MAAPASTSRWFRAWHTRRLHQRLHQADFGDHGTAFGLDLSLSQLTDSQLTDPPPMPRRSWMQRLRGRPAAPPL